MSDETQLRHQTGSFLQRGPSSAPRGIVGCLHPSLKYKGLRSIGKTRGTLMALINFDPPLGPASSASFEIKNFQIGSSDGKGSDGKGYPPHMRQIWLPQQSDAIVEMSNFITEQQIAVAKVTDNVLKQVM